MKDLTLTEEMFLLAVWKLKDDAYGVTIRQHVSEETGRTYPYGTLYSALDKLARKDFLTRSTGDPSPERGGRRRIPARNEGAAGNTIITSRVRASKR
jgi:DNA-binding PadR family transcriptional regulator